jgi:DNA-binding transcriptional MerR regulator
MKNKPILTVGAVARQLGCTSQTVRNLTERSGITPTRDTANRRLFSQGQAAALAAFQKTPKG